MYGIDFLSISVLPKLKYASMKNLYNLSPFSKSKGNEKLRNAISDVGFLECSQASQLPIKYGA